MNSPATASALDSRDLALLAALTFFWGINWPIMKYGVLEFPPLTFRFISMVGGLFCLGLVAH
ncbi:MAG: EamA family transporter, partial [Burkholderiales bacterium]|nr:EamA family transporter [Burkholderiales bacterium]